MKTSARPALLLLALTAACGRDDASPSATPVKSDRAGLQTVASKPALVPAGQRRVLELEGGVRVEVLAEGEGPVVGPGDEVALSMTLSYVPQPPSAKPDETKDEGAKADEKSDAKPKKKSKSKSDADSESKPDAKPDEKPADAPDPSAPAPLEVAATGAVGETAPAETKPVDAPSPAAEVASAPAASDAKPDDAKSDDAKPQDAKPDAAQPTDAKPETEVPAADAEKPAPSETPAADAPPAAPLPSVDPAPLPAALEPVIVVSTKNLGTPIRARIGATGGLLPGLSRALVGLRAGTVAEITLPPEAGYGVAGLVSAGIPAGTTLLATIEIREVKR